MTGAGVILGVPYITHVSDHQQTDVDPLDMLGTGLVDLDFMIGNFLPISNAIVDQAISQSKRRVKQACAANSGGTCSKHRGYLGPGEDVITAAPGVFCIDPGYQWSNFVAAAQAEVEYTIKDVQLKKQTPEIVQCADVFPEKTVVQHGTTSIRLWWPAMYEVPGTTWTLTILYGTPQLFDPDGPGGPKPPAYVHQEVWQWTVEIDLRNMRNAIELFHEVPFGLDEVPLISDEPLFEDLLAYWDQVVDFVVAGDTANAARSLIRFELAVMDACIDVSPRYPNPTGPGTGIANSEENPACCKLLADAEYLGKTLGFLMPAR